MEEITKGSIDQAIEKIERNPQLLNGRKSIDYDLVLDNGKSYPPILVLSEANQILGGKELYLSDFGNSVSRPFQILNTLGFNVEKKSFFTHLKNFLNTANTQITGQGTNEKAKNFNKSVSKTYKGLNVDISFGIGRATAIPWISFLGDGQKTSKGIYPVYLFFKENNLLILAYGISETHQSDLKWNLQKSKTLAAFFQDNNLGPIKNYGKSFLFKAYNINEELTKDIVDQDLDNIIAEYKETLRNQSKKIQMVVQKEIFDYRKFFEKTKEISFHITDSLCIRFISSLITKPFVILTGLSGSGKTKLALAFAKWIANSKEQICIIPVGADWTNREPILGYTNALVPDTYVLPENGALQLIINAINNPDKPYFLILDEMNLSHVERYFADFLSAMESKEVIFLHSGEKDYQGVPPSIALPNNFFIIGTVNIDETTYMFSPKVLDRANVIEFRIDENEMKGFLNGKNSLDLKKLESDGANMASDFLEKANFHYDTSDMDVTNDLLNFFKELKQVGAEFGYRTASEIIRFIAVTNQINNKWTKDQIIDAAIMQKLLPKLHGSRRKLEPTLKSLAELCLKDKALTMEALNPKKYFDFSDNSKIKFPISLEKIRRMNNGLISNNFTSYAEA